MKNEEESTSLELEEKNEEVEAIPKMTPWTFVQEELLIETVSGHSDQIISRGCAQATKGVLLLLPREGWRQKSSSVP